MSSTNVDKANYREQYASLFEACSDFYRTHTGEGMLAFRTNGMEEFSRSGFPTTKDEDWRFTNLKALEGFIPESMSGTEVSSAPTSELLNDLPFSDIHENRLVFVDGVFQESLSYTKDQPQGVDLMPLSNAIKLGLIRDEEMGQYSSESHKNTFVPLNDALFHDGLFLRVAKGVSVDGTVQVIYFTTGSNGNIHFPRQLVIMGENATATVIEQHHTASSIPTFKNGVSEIFLGESCHCEIVKLQMESDDCFHFGSYFVHATSEADFRIHSFDVGAKISRNSLKTHLNGTKIHGVLNGLYVCKGTQLSDHHMIVEHMQPSCDSHEYFNGILDDRSRGVFHGRIFVDQKGQKTDAKQTNKNILLTDDVTIDTKPQLEIYADDVKCTHGATVGQLDEESLFYLQARGIPRREARRMLIHAFAGEIVDRIHEPALREEMDRVIWDTLDHLPSLMD